MPNPNEPQTHLIPAAAIAHDPEAHGRLEALAVVVHQTAQDVTEIKLVLAGDMRTQTPGLQEVLRKISERQDSMEARLDRHSDRLRDLEQQAKQHLEREFEAARLKLEAELEEAKRELEEAKASKTWLARAISEKALGAIIGSLVTGTGGVIVYLIVQMAHAPTP